jgi:hypothetical protein
MTGVSALTIEHSLIANLPHYGVNVVGTGTVKIADTIMRNNLQAVYLVDGARGVISRTQIFGNVFGALVVGSNTATTTTASVIDSLISGGSDGITAASYVVGGAGRVFVTRSTIEGVASSALFCGADPGSCQITVSYSMITNNGYGWYLQGAGGVVKSLGNNHFVDNAGNVGSLTTAALQ